MASFRKLRTFSVLVATILLCGAVVVCVWLHQSQHARIAEKDHILPKAEMYINLWVRVLDTRPYEESERKWYELKSGLGSGFYDASEGERESIWQLVDRYFATQRFDRAYLVAKKELSDTRSDAWLTRYTALLAGLNRDVSWLEQAAKHEANPVMVEYLNGTLEYARRNYATALAGTERITEDKQRLSLNPEMEWSVWFRILRAQCWKELGNRQKAMKEIDSAAPTKEGARKDQLLFLYYLKLDAEIAHSAGMDKRIQEDIGLLQRNRAHIPWHMPFLAQQYVEAEKKLQLLRRSPATKVAP